MRSLRRSLACRLIVAQAGSGAASAAPASNVDVLAPAIALHEEANAALQAGKFALAAERFEAAYDV